VNSELIEKYYSALRRAQSTLYTDNGKLNEWILFFFESLRKQVSALESKIETEKLIAQLPQQPILILIYRKILTGQRCMNAKTFDAGT